MLVSRFQFGRSALVDANPLVRYGVSIALLLAAALARLGLGLIVNRPLSAPLFLAAIILSTWLGGVRLGIFASIVAAATLDYFFAQPLVGVLELRDHLVRFLLFSIEGSLLSWLVDRLRVTSEEMVASREELRELAEQQRSVRDAEQKRIAREIHDELGQALTSLKLGIHLLKRNISNGNGVEDKLTSEIDDLSKQVDSTIGTVRRIATELRPSVLDDFGLVAAIEWQTKEFGSRSGIDCIFSSNVDEIELESDASTAVFRILQEALTNIGRHADATQVHVRFEHSNGDLQLTVDDNGRGIDRERTKKNRSLGLLGMRERARLLEGEVSISSSKNGGTQVRLVAPVKLAAHQENK